MKNKKRTVFLSILAGTILSVAAVFSAQGYTDGDPLITLSYLENVFKPAMREEIVQSISTINPAPQVQPEASVQNPPAQEQTQEVVDNTSLPVSTVPSEEGAVNIDNVQQSQASATYTLVELVKGQTIMADSICEFIVRPGSTVAAVSPFPAQGIADITNGIEVLGGQNISINAYCLIPRGSDGRGMTVLSEKAYIMIRGDYTIG